MAPFSAIVFGVVVWTITIAVSGAKHLCFRLKTDQCGRGLTEWFQQQNKFTTDFETILASFKAFSQRQNVLKRAKCDVFNHVICAGENLCCSLTRDYEKFKIFRSFLCNHLSNYTKTIIRLSLVPRGNTNIHFVTDPLICYQYARSLLVVLFCVKGKWDDLIAFNLKICKMERFYNSLRGRPQKGRKVKMSAGVPQSSRVRSSRASRARLSPFPPLRKPATQANFIMILMFLFLPFLI